MILTQKYDKCFTYMRNIEFFSYDEYIDIRGVKTRGSESYIGYMNSGGLPELFHIHGDEISQLYIEGLRDSKCSRTL